MYKEHSSLKPVFDYFKRYTSPRLALQSIKKVNGNHACFSASVALDKEGNLYIDDKFKDVVCLIKYNRYTRKYIVRTANDTYENLTCRQAYDFLTKFRTQMMLNEHQIDTINL